MYDEEHLDAKISQIKLSDKNSSRILAEFLSQFYTKEYEQTTSLSKQNDTELISTSNKSKLLTIDNFNNIITLTINNFRLNYGHQARVTKLNRVRPRRALFKSFFPIAVSDR